MKTARMPVVALFALSAGLSAADGEGWQYMKRTDGFTDEVRHNAAVRVKDGLSTAAIMVACSSGDLMLVVSLADRVENDAAVRIKYRFDKQEAIEEEWLGFSGGKAVATPEPEAFARKLMSANTLLFRAYTPTGYTEQRFPMKNSAASIKPVLEACS